MAAAEEQGKQMPEEIEKRGDEADVGIVRPHGDGAVHAIAPGHEVTELAGADESIPAGQGVGTAEIDEEDAVIGLFGGEFLEPGDEAAGGVLVAGFCQRMHFENLIEEGVGVGLRGGCRGGTQRSG